MDQFGTNICVRWRWREFIPPAGSFEKNGVCHACVMGFLCTAAVPLGGPFVFTRQDRVHHLYTCLALVFSFFTLQTWDISPAVCIAFHWLLTYFGLSCIDPCAHTPFKKMSSTKKEIKTEPKMEQFQDMPVVMSMTEEKLLGGGKGKL